MLLLLKSWTRTCRVPRSREWMSRDRGLVAARREGNGEEVCNSETVANIIRWRIITNLAEHPMDHPWRGAVSSEMSRDPARRRVCARPPPSWSLYSSQLRSRHDQIRTLLRTLPVLPLQSGASESCVEAAKLFLSAQIGIKFVQPAGVVAGVLHSVRCAVYTCWRMGVMRLSWPC
jgi:hypothetical protein